MQPLSREALLSSVDSEGEEGEESRAVRERRELFEYSDVRQAEKEVMLLWNEFALQQMWGGRCAAVGFGRGLMRHMAYGAQGAVQRALSLGAAGLR